MGTELNPSLRINRHTPAPTRDSSKPSGTRTGAFTVRPASPHRARNGQGLLHIQPGCFQPAHRTQPRHHADGRGKISARGGEERPGFSQGSPGRENSGEIGRQRAEGGGKRAGISNQSPATSDPPRTETGGQSVSAGSVKTRARCSQPLLQRLICARCGGAVAVVAGRSLPAPR